MREDVTLFGETRCAKTRFYRAALVERGVAFELAEVDKDQIAAQRLVSLTGSAEKFPTLEIKGRKVRNPKLADLDKELARAGLFDPGLIHDETSHRFVRHMAPTDAFVSYSIKNDRMVLGHIEVAPSLHGSGLGTRLAGEVFDALLDSDHQLRITSPFLRRVAEARPEWRRKFNIKEA
jgi:arsenate reductase-like glutaredoxin family protein